MTLCPKCGKELAPPSSVCQSCSDEPAFANPEKPRNGIQKVLYILLIAIGAWITGLFTVALFQFTFMSVGPEEREYTLGHVLPTLVLISCIALVLAWRDTEDLRPIHVVLGSAVGSAIGFFVWFVWWGTTPSPLLDSDVASLLCWLFVVTPASGVIGMIRGIRARSSEEPLSALFYCALLITACCVGAWMLSFTSIGRVFTGPTTRQLSVPYTSPQHDAAATNPR